MYVRPDRNSPAAQRGQPSRPAPRQQPPRGAPAPRRGAGDGSRGGCTEITDEVTVEYTVDHELLDEWRLEFDSDAPHTGGYPPGGLGGSTPRGANGSAAFVVTDDTASPPVEWPECSYDVRLSSRRKLTDGDSNDDRDAARDTFCVSRSDDET